MSIRSKQGYAEFLKEDAIEQQQRAGELKRRQAREIFELRSSWMVENLPQVNPESLVGQSAEQAVQAIRNAFDAFRLGLDNRGVTLLPAGLRKLQRVAELNESVDWANPESFTKAFDYIESLGTFNDTDRTIPVQPLVEQLSVEAKKVSLDDFSLDTREGSRRGRQLVSEQVGDEEKAAWEKFIQGIYEETGHLLTNQERLAIFNTCKRRGLDIRNPRRVREAVVALCNTGELPGDKILSEQDKLNAFIEVSDLSDIAVRQEINRRQRAIHETAERKRLGFS